MSDIFDKVFGDSIEKVFERKVFGTKSLKPNIEHSTWKQKSFWKQKRTLEKRKPSLNKIFEQTH